MVKHTIDEKVSALADTVRKDGEAVIFVDETPKYILLDFQTFDKAAYEEALIRKISEQDMKERAKVYEELAK